MKAHFVSGAGKTRLHLVETGNAEGPPILFIHGYSQSALSWRRQLNSNLADRCRLVAMDLRGHGLSDKPRDGYMETRIWAEDVHAVIRTLDLDRPVLCGWSYASLVILDYMRHYGDGDIRGVNFVGGVTKLGSDEAASVLSAEFLNLVPGFFSSDMEESVAALDSLLRICYGPQLTNEDRYLMLGYSVSVPPYVRRALFSRALDNDDILPALRKPVLVTHGAADAVVKPAVVDRQMARIPRTEVRIMANAGHACFWDGAAVFNQSLQEFAEAL